MCSTNYDNMIARALGLRWDVGRSLYPTVADGVDGMRFIAQCVAYSQGNGVWLPLK